MNNIWLFCQFADFCEDLILGLFELYPTDVNITGVLREAIKWSQGYRTKKENIKKAHPSLLLTLATRYISSLFIFSSF